MLKGKRITKPWSFRSLLAVIICLLVIVGTLALSVKSHAYENSYTNSDTGYNVDIIDDADVFTDEEEEELRQIMSQITQYGNAVLYTTDTYEGDSKTASLEQYNKKYDAETDNGVIYTMQFSSDHMSYDLRLVHAGAFSVWLENGTAQSIVDEGANKASESDYASAKYVFEEYYKALESSDRKPHYEPATEEGTDTVPAAAEEETESTDAKDDLTDH